MLLIRLITMLEADEVDIDFFTPSASTSLAKIFNNDVKFKENENDPLKYVPTPPQTLAPKEESKVTQMVYACPVFGYEWVNNAYVSRGKLGAAIIKTIQSCHHNILLYDANKTTLSCTVISPQLEVVMKGNLNISYYDSHKRYWSIYGAQAEFFRFIEELKMLNVQVRDSSNNEKEPMENILEQHEENVALNKIANLDKESDTDFSIYKKSKDSIIKRMATMGHSVLPTQSIPSVKSDESSDSEESAQKIIRHKLHKSNFRRSMTEKEPFHSNNIIDIDITSQTSLLKHTVELPIEEQQLMPITSTNLITNPIINNSSELNLLMSEQRISNSELRININRLSDKMDKILDTVQSDPENKTSARNFQNEIVQKLISEYENKIECYEIFLKSKGFDCTIISTLESKDNTLSLQSDVVLNNKIKELQNLLEDQNSEIFKLTKELESLHEKYENSCVEFNKKIDEQIKEISCLQQSLETKLEETAPMQNLPEMTNSATNNEFKNKLKYVMNEIFHSLSANFNNDANYKGSDIKSLIANVIKKETIKACKEI